MHIMHVKNEFLYSFFFYYYSWILYMHLINIKALVLNLAEPCCTGFFFSTSLLHSNGFPLGKFCESRDV